MRRITVLAAAGGVAVAVGVISFTLGRALTVQESAQTAMSAKVAEPASHQIAVRTQPSALSAPPVASPLPASFATVLTPERTNDVAARNSACGNPDALGVSRVVEIDTAGGPGFGFEQFKAYDFLREHEVVLTFDDGPWPGNTPAVLKALADQCTKALFFPIGKHAMWHPEILKQVAAAGHTVGSHTWSHADLSKLTADQAKEEFEKGASAVHAALADFRGVALSFPGAACPAGDGGLSRDTKHRYLLDRHGLFDFKIRKPEQVVLSVMTKLKKRGKGIVLLHDFQHPTSLALPELLAQLKAGGYKIVLVKSKAPLKTLPEYDDAIMKEFGGSTVNIRPTSSVVSTVGE